MRGASPRRSRTGCGKTSPAGAILCPTWLHARMPVEVAFGTCSLLRLNAFCRPLPRDCRLRVV